MSEPKPPFLMLAVGLVALFGGIIIELATNPLQPISYVPGLIFFPIAIGLALALLERKLRIAAIVAYYIVLLWVLYAIGRAETSVLPLGLLIAAYALARFALFFYRDEPPKKRPVRRY